jgi:hypothetical protein
MVAFARQHAADKFAALDRFGRVVDQLTETYEYDAEIPTQCSAATSVNAR